MIRLAAPRLPKVQPANATREVSIFTARILCNDGGPSVATRKAQAPESEQSVEPRRVREIAREVGLRPKDLIEVIESWREESGETWEIAGHWSIVPPDLEAIILRELANDDAKSAATSAAKPAPATRAAATRAPGRRASSSKAAEAAPEAETGAAPKTKAKSKTKKADAPAETAALEEVAPPKAKAAPAKKAPAAKAPAAKAPAAKAKSAPAKKASASTTDEAPAKKAAAPKGKASKSKSAVAVDADAADAKPASTKAKRTTKAKASAAAATADAAEAAPPKAKSGAKTKTAPTKQTNDAAPTEPKAVSAAVVAEAERPSAAPAVVAYLKKALEAVGYHVPHVTTREDGDVIEALITGFEIESLLGPGAAAARTSAIEALEHLASRVATSFAERNITVRVDVAGFRQSRADVVAAAAKRISEFVSASGRPVRFGVMNAFDRFAFHNASKVVEGVRSESDGHGVFRRLGIYPTRPRS